MAGRLSGRVAVITGGASGMGRATTLRFLDEGASVVVADMNEESGKQTLELAAKAGHGEKVRFIRTDVADEPSVEAMIDCAVSEFSRLDCVFNNAGVGGAFGPVTEIEVEDWDYTFAVLVRGVFLGIKHGARAMEPGGSIINTASVAGLSGGGGPLCYSAAKAAVVNLGLAAAVELAPKQIRVNTICPGGIVTPLVMRGQDEEQVAERMKSLQPWPEAGRGEHIAGAALFLASDDARFVTGETLVVDGGLTAAGPNLFNRMGGDGPRTPFAGMVGVSRGNTGQPPVIRER
ncbi:MAG: SDR family oxidoreductase [Deltaproteobacteria bacterium]|nr:SDR family oxidoreductase [Deltaproteobacteria bacterium]